MSGSAPRWALLFVCLATCQAMRSTARSATGHLECSSAVRGAPAPRKDALLDLEKGDDWHLIAIVSGYMAQLGSSTEHLAARLCEASHGAVNKSLIVALESNLGAANSVEHIEVQGQRAAEELKQLLQWNQRQGRHFSGYSLVGHSMGGLVARVMAAQIDTLKPRVFISMFSPHAGVDSFTATHVIPTFLSLARLDKGASADVLEPDVNKSILVRLAEGSYAAAFRSFEKRVLYGSPSDWLVDFGSAVLSSATDGNELTKLTNVTEEYPLLHIRSFTASPRSATASCSTNSVRCRVLTLLSDVPLQRVQLDWSMSHPEKHSQKDMTLSESLELTRHLAMELGSSFALPRGAQCGASGAGTSLCAPALECRHGLCQPQLLEPESSCVPGLRSECQHIIGVVNDILKQMTLIVTSSGGGGHLVAAKNLQETLLQEAEYQVEAIESILSTSGRVLTAEAQDLAKAAVTEVKKPTVEMLDLMNSGCTDLGIFRFGAMMSEQWNQLQRAGDIAGLKRLVTAQPLTQTIFGASCKNFMSRVCEGQNRYGLPVTRLYTTQPLLLKSLLEACSATSQVDLFMTDLPTTEAVHFFQPLKSIEAQLNSVWKRKFYLHSLPPALGGRAELERLSGVPQHQIYLEKFMPVNRAFTKPEGLPMPGEALALKLKAQLPLEEEFLKELGNPLILRPEDEVMLVMLGSQPTASAVAGYAAESLKLPAPDAGKRYVLLACGKPKVEAYAQLYTEMVQLARENQGSTVLVPFTGQDAKEMLGRADVTITRSGGMTAGELLALRTRKDDKKQMLLHVESVPDSEATKILAKHLQNKPEKEALAAAFVDAALEGMVPWEAGNARYLMTAVGAQVVVPKIFVSVMHHQTPALPFNVDWRSLLYLRGFGADEIAFATAPDNCEAPHQASCEHGFSDLPLPESVAGTSGCRDAMRAYDGSAMTFHLAADVAANREGRFINSHSCGGAQFLVRQRPSQLAAVFFNIDSAAKGVVSSCGGRMMTCGNFVLVQLPPTRTR